MPRKIGGKYERNFDTHCHLMSHEYENEETSAIIADAKISGVSWFNNVGYDLASSQAAVRHAMQYDNVLQQLVFIQLMLLSMVFQI